MIDLVQECVLALAPNFSPKEGTKSHTVYSVEEPQSLKIENRYVSSHKKRITQSPLSHLKKEKVRQQFHFWTAMLESSRMQVILSPFLSLGQAVRREPSQT